MRWTSGSTTSAWLLVGVVLVALTACGPEVTEPAAAVRTTADATQRTSATPTSAPRTTAPTTSATPTAAANGSLVVRLTAQSGSVTVVPSDQGFTVLREQLGTGMSDQSQVTAYDLGGRPLATVRAPNLTGECGVTDALSKGRRILLTRKIAEQPAAGINPALYSDTLTGWDARSGARLWDIVVTAPQVDYVGCSQYSHDGLDDLQLTSDGTYAVLNPGRTGTSPLLVDLADGTATAISDLMGTVGPWVVRQVENGDYQDATDIVIDPATGAELSRFVNAQDEVGITFGRDAYGWSTHTFGGQYGTDPAGTVVFGSRSGDRFDEAVGYQLPGMGLLWEAARDAGDLRPWAASDTVLLAGFGDLGFETGMVALDPHTGSELWTLPEVQLCGLTGSQLLVQANNQWAVIDSATGDQVQYGPLDGVGAAPYAHCTVTPQGLSFDVGDDDTISVYQALQP